MLILPDRFFFLYRVFLERPKLKCTARQSVPLVRCNLLNSVYSQWWRSLNDIRHRISILEHPRAHDARQKYISQTARWDESFLHIVPHWVDMYKQNVYIYIYYFAFKCTIHIAWFSLFKILLILLWRAVIHCSSSACNNIIVNKTHYFCKLYL